jgi:hypothetical protein
MEFEVGKIYANNNNEFRKILNMYNNVIEYEKLEVIKCDDIDSFSDWAMAGSKKEFTPIIDKIETRHFTTTYSNDLDDAINDWVNDMNYEYHIIDIDIKYATHYIERNNSTRFSALVILKLKEL